jgi:hypothetical protein
MAMSCVRNDKYCCLYLTESGYIAVCKSPIDERDPKSRIRLSPFEAEVRISETKLTVDLPGSMTLVDFCGHHWETNVLRTISPGQYTFLQMQIPEAPQGEAVILEGTVWGLAPIGFSRACRSLGVTVEVCADGGAG